MLVFKKSILDVLKNVTFDWTSFDLSAMKLLSTNEEFHEIPVHVIKWSEVPIYPECQALNLFHYFDFSKITPLQITFYFNKKSKAPPGTVLGLYLEDKNKALKRRLSSSNILAYSGNSLVNENLSSGRHIKAVISLSQTIDLEDDKEKQCKNYPAEGFQDYNACDRNFAYRELKEKYQLVPFWATDNMSEVTKYKEVKSMPPTLEYVDGTITSPCFVPCVSTEVCYCIHIQTHKTRITLPDFRIYSLRQ